MDAIEAYRVLRKGMLIELTIDDDHVFICEVTRDGNINQPDSIIVIDVLIDKNRHYGWESGQLLYLIDSDEVRILSLEESMMWKL